MSHEVPPDRRHDLRRKAPAAARNREPIFHAIEPVLPAHGYVLEIASGTGEHVVYFAERCPSLMFQPTDADPDARESINAWVAHSALSNVNAPIALDVTESPWPVAHADVVLCFNMVHIAPWEATLALFEGAARIVPPGGLCVLYGPFRVAGAHTAESNARFDADLRARDPRWGVRDLEAVTGCAIAQGFAEPDVIEMPANNKTLVFRRQ